MHTQLSCRHILQPLKTEKMTADKDTYQEGSTTAYVSQPNPAGARKCEGPAGRKMCEKKSWETEKLSRERAERIN